MLTGSAGLPQSGVSLVQEPPPGDWQGFFMRGVATRFATRPDSMERDRARRDGIETGGNPLRRNTIRDQAELRETAPAVLRLFNLTQPRLTLSF